MLAMLDFLLFPNITTPTTSHVHWCELIFSERLMSEKIDGGVTTASNLISISTTATE